MDRGHGGAAAPRHRLRDEYDGIARWLAREQPEPTISARWSSLSLLRDVTARNVRARRWTLRNWGDCILGRVCGTHGLGFLPKWYFRMEQDHLGDTNYSVDVGLATAENARRTGFFDAGNALNIS